MHFVSHLHEDRDAERRGESVAKKHAPEKHRRISVSVQCMSEPIERTDMVQHIREDEAAAQETEFWILAHHIIIAEIACTCDGRLQSKYCRGRVMLR